MTHWEWLVNFEELIGKGEFDFFGVPLKFKGGSGSPVRAFAVVTAETNSTTVAGRDAPARRLAKER